MKCVHGIDSDDKRAPLHGACTPAETVRVFEFKPGRIRRGFMHFACVNESWKAGKFHAPVLVPEIDLEGEACRMCLKPMVGKAD
jgi:hypothetical protein